MTDISKLHEIEDILRDADFLMLHVENRDLAKTGEYLTRCILKLDFISTASDDVRNKRREAVKHLQMYLGRIEESIRCQNGDPSNNPIIDSPSSSDDSDVDSDQTDSSSDEESSMTEDWSEDEISFIHKLIGSKKSEAENRHKLRLAGTSVFEKMSNLITWLFFLLYLWKCTNMVSDNAFGALLGFLHKVLFIDHFHYETNSIPMHSDTTLYLETIGLITLTCPCN